MKQISRAKYDKMLLAKDEHGNLKISTDKYYKQMMDKYTEQFTSDKVTVRNFRRLDGTMCVEVNENYENYGEDYEFE